MPSPSTDDRRPLPARHRRAGDGPYAVANGQGMIAAEFAPGFALRLA